MFYIHYNKKEKALKHSHGSGISLITHFSVFRSFAGTTRGQQREQTNSQEIFRQKGVRSTLLSLFQDPADS